MALNIQPGAGFMQRMLGATNAVGSSMGGPMGQASRLSGGMNQNRINRQPMPNRQTTPNMGMMPPGLPSPNPSGMGGPISNPGSPMSPGMNPSMPIVQGPTNMPDFQMGQNTGGNMGVTGGMNFGGMGGFPRPQIDTGNVMNDNQMGGGIWSRYQNMQPPQQNTRLPMQAPMSAPMFSR